MSVPLCTSWHRSRFATVTSLDGLPVRPARPRPGENDASARTVEQLDSLAVALRAAAETITVPLARAAHEVVRRSVWLAAGHATLDGYARERLGPSGRWVRDLARLARAMKRFPALLTALATLPRSRIQLILPVLDDDNVDAWIARARTLTVRELRRTLRDRGLDPRVDPDELDDRMQVNVLAWSPVTRAFAEMVELGRSVMGHDATVATVVDAMLAETELSACPDVDPAPGSGLDGAALHHANAGPTTVSGAWWADLDRTQLARAARRAIDALERIERLSAVDPAGLDDFGLERHFHELIGLDERIERRIGDLLVAMSERGAWSRLGFEGVGHYGQERLGMARTSAEDRAYTARTLRAFPLLRSAYEDGRLPFGKALTVLRVLGRTPAAGNPERAWLEAASEYTVKRLRDEARALGHGSGKPPLPDDAWYASIRRAPGDARIRVLQAGAEVLAAASRDDRPDVFLRLRLPQSIAVRFMAAIEQRRRDIEAEVDVVPLGQPWPSDDVRPAVRAARELHVRGRPIPACLGLLSVIEDTVAAWDPVRIPARPLGYRIHERAGYRCEAPGCTNRDRLEWHHLRRVSCGGSGDDSNGLSLCWTHHHDGEHGGRTRAEGTAPLDVTWRLGTGAFTRWYRNEREVPPLH